MVGACSCTPVHTPEADANITYLIRGHCREPHLPGQPAGCSGDEGCPTPCAGGGADLHVQNECARDRSSHCHSAAHRQHEDGHGRDGSIYGGSDLPVPVSAGEIAQRASCGHTCSCQATKALLQKLPDHDVRDHSSAEAVGDTLLEIVITGVR